MFLEIMDVLRMLKVRRIERAGRYSDALENISNFHAVSPYYDKFAQVYKAKLMMTTYHPESRKFIESLMYQRAEFAEVYNGNYLMKYIEYLDAILREDNQRIFTLALDLKKLDVIVFVKGCLPVFSLSELK